MGYLIKWPTRRQSVKHKTSFCFGLNMVNMTGFCKRETSFRISTPFCIFCTSFVWYWLSSWRHKNRNNFCNKTCVVLSCLVLVVLKQQNWMLSVENHFLVYINLAWKPILYWHNMFCITMREILFRGVMWHTYSRCCKKPLPDGWNFAWWWSQMQHVTFTWTWWLFCTEDKFRKHSGTGKLVCLMMVCFWSAQTHKYFDITDQTSWWLVVWRSGAGY